MKSICISEGTLYYSDASIGTLMLYLQDTLGKRVPDLCDQGRVIDINGKYLVFGDTSIEGSLEIIGDILKSQKVFFHRSSDKNLNPVVHKKVNVLISDPICDYNPIMRSV